MLMNPVARTKYKTLYSCESKTFDATANTMPIMTIGKRIIGARLACGYDKPAEFARSCKVSKQYLNNLEKDRVKKPDPNELVKIARFADVSVEWIVTGEGVPSRSLDLSNDESDFISALREMPEEKREMAFRMIKSALGIL